MKKELFEVAMGRKPADLVITNGKVVNVFTGEVYPGGVAIAGDRIAAVGEVGYAIGAGTTVIDAGGNYITPGFIDGHIHPESSALKPESFAEVVLCHGTTSVFTDIHEVGVVGGMPALEAVLREFKKTPLRCHWVIPSHIPFSPDLETSGGRIDSGMITEALKRPDAVGISEVVSAYVAIEHPDLLRSIDATTAAEKVLSGHGPDIKGPLANAFAAIGVLNDHEALSAEDVLIRARSGIFVHLRHNLIVPTLPELLKPLLEKRIDSRMIGFGTDDTSAVVLVDEGHIDYLIRLAVQLGLDFVTAIQFATLNNAASFRRDRELGALAPGFLADVNIVSGPEDMRVLKTIAGGLLVAEKGRLVKPMAPIAHEKVLLKTFHIKARLSADDLVIPAKAGTTSATVKVMRTLPWVPITTGGEASLPVRGGHIASDIAQDLVHIAVIERHHGTGNIGKAFIGGFNLRAGALASSVGHDHHNIVVMGADPVDLAVAANRVAEIDGGIVVVKDGKVVREIAYPLLGLLSDLDARSLSEERKVILKAAAELGASVVDPFMFLSFVTLAAIPEYAVTDRGFVDVATQSLVDPVLSWS